MMESLGAWIVAAIVALIIGLAVRKVYKDYKNGKSCGCGCDNCSACPDNEHNETAGR